MSDRDYFRGWAVIGYLSGIVICLIMYAYTTNFHIYQSRMPYTYARFDFENELENINDYKNISVGYAIDEVNTLFDFVYILDFDEISPVSGTARILTRVVVMDKDISGWEALETLTHELLHIKLWMKDENCIEFLTFKILYESANPLLNLKAKEIAYMQCTEGCRIGTEYDCSYYIAEYLKERQI